jgi:hypothetical protein
MGGLFGQRWRSSAARYDPSGVESVPLFPSPVDRLLGRKNCNARGPSTDPCFDLADVWTIQVHWLRPGAILISYRTPRCSTARALGNKRYTKPQRACGDNQCAVVRLPRPLEYERFLINLAK